jgi:hypothetical protein
VLDPVLDRPQGDPEVSGNLPQRHSMPHGLDHFLTTTLTMVFLPMATSSPPNELPQIMPSLD